MSFTPHEKNLAILNNITPSMRYRGEERFKAWQECALKKLNELLGLPFERCDEDFKIEYETEHEIFTEIRFSFQSEQGYYVPCHFLIPQGAALPFQPKGKVFRIR